MKSALLALGTLGLAAQAPAIAPPLPPVESGGLPRDAKDQQPLLLGPTTAQAILAHRAVFRETLARSPLPGALRVRWKAIQRPFTLVAVFGSWCGDSHYQLPDLLALASDPNPFIEVHYLGVYRDKRVEAAHWPSGCAPQPVQRVPTFFLFATEPGGGQRLVGSVVENPPRSGQRMGEALVELLEVAASRP